MNQEKHSHIAKEVIPQDGEAGVSADAGQPSRDIPEDAGILEDENREIFYILERIAAKWRGEKPPETPEKVVASAVSARPEDVSEKTVIMQQPFPGNMDKDDLDKTVLFSPNKIPGAVPPPPEPQQPESMDETVLLNASNMRHQGETVPSPQQDAIHKPKTNPVPEGNAGDETVILNSTLLPSDSLCEKKDAPPPQSQEPYDPDATIIINGNKKDAPIPPGTPEPLLKESGKETPLQTKAPTADIPAADETVILGAASGSAHVDTDATIIMGSPKTPPAQTGPKPEVSHLPETLNQTVPEHDQTVSIQTITETGETIVIPQKDMGSFPNDDGKQDRQTMVPVQDVPEDEEDDSDDDVILQTVILGPNSYEQ